MQYLGGKSRIAQHIAHQVRSLRGDRSTYAEPFLGAGSVALQLAGEFERMILMDTAEDLILLWRAVAHQGWIPPTELTEAEWRDLRSAPPSALRGFAGFACSFGGRWFEGYARDPKGGRNFAASGSRSLVRRGQALRGASIYCQDYRRLPELVDLKDSVIYLDPPYAGTKTYGAVGPFDSREFWVVARNWSAMGALVLVSEYTAPDDWVPVWSGTPVSTISRSNHTKDGALRRAPEHLFVHSSVQKPEVGFFAAVAS